MASTDNGNPSNGENNGNPSRFRDEEYGEIEERECPPIDIRNHLDAIESLGFRMFHAQIVSNGSLGSDTEVSSLVDEAVTCYKGLNAATRSYFAAISGNRLEEIVKEFYPEHLETWKMFRSLIIHTGTREYAFSDREDNE